MIRAARSLPQRRAWIALLVLGLVLAQALGLVHRIVHVPAVLSGAAAPAASTEGRSGGDPSMHVKSASSTSSTTSTWSWATLLFGHASGDRACHLYDQLTHGDALQPAVPLVASAPPESGCAPADLAPHLAAQATGFLARGPPHTT